MNLSVHGRPIKASELIVGVSIDEARPKLKNEDGSTSTEETITVERGGKWYNVPTIVNGRRFEPEHVQWRFEQSDPDFPHVGEFGTLDDAVKAAQSRSVRIGKVRGVR